MENEQEGIRLETIDSEAEGIVLPSVEEEVDTETVDTETETETTTKIDEEKESLKRGVNAERSKRKAAEKKARELEDRIRALEEANRTPEKTTLDTLIESGVDESIAKSIAAAIYKKQTTNSELERKIANTNFEIALTKKSKEQGFEDIEEYSDDLKIGGLGLTIIKSFASDINYERKADFNILTMKFKA